MYTENDKLERTEFIDTLEKIIDKKFNDRDGFSFAIDGKWGCGKTFIVNMLEERLKNKYLVIKYNCWKYDYYEEPVMAIMSVIADALNKIAAENIRVDVDNSDDRVGKKIRNASKEWIPYIVVIGDKEVETDNYNVTVRKTGEKLDMTADELIASVKEETEGMPFRRLPLPRNVSERINFK